MNKSFSWRILSYYLLTIIFCSSLNAQETQRKKVELITYYELIGLDEGQLTKEALNAVNNDADYISAKKAWDDAIATKDAKAIQKTADKKEKIREKIENNFLHEKIREACIQARKNYQKQLEKTREQIGKAEEFEQKALYETINDLQKRLMLTSTACPLLLDPAKRRAYDERLARPEVAETHFQQVQRGIEEATLFAPSKKVVLNEILGDILSSIEIPGPALKIFNQNLEVRSLAFLPRPMGPDVRYGLGFTGLMALNRFEVRLSVYVIQNIYGERKFSFSVELPDTYKISDLFPSYKGFDAFKFPQAKFIIANFEGTDKDNFPFKKGFNFVAMLDLSGPLKVLSELKDKAAGLKALVFENKPIVMHGVIPLNIAQAEFTATVPLYFGVDLRQISVIPPTISNVIQKITSDEFTLTISPVKPKKIVKEETGEKVAVKPSVEVPALLGKVSTLESIPLIYQIEAETGIRITLGTQREPIRFNVLGLVIPISKNHPQGLLSVGGSMKGMLQLGLVAFGNIIIRFDFDGALMAAAAAVGVPFTGIIMHGEVDLGREGESRASLQATAGLRVAASVIPIDFIVELSGSNIRFADLISYASKLAAKAKVLKAPIPLEQIPTMTLHRVWGYSVLKDTTIGGVSYPAGIGLEVETQLFEHKAGFRVFLDNKFKLSGWGYMPRIDFKVKGTELFELSGLTADTGPRVSFSFDPKEPAKGMFGVQGVVHLPTLGLKQKTDFMWRGYTLDADFETAFPAGFSVLFGIRMNLKAGAEMLSPYDQAKREIEQLIDGADKEATEVLAAIKLMNEADTLYYEKRSREAMSRLTQARSLVAGLKPVVKSKRSVQIASVPKAVNVKTAEGQMEAIKQDVFALFKKAGDLYKQDDAHYAAARALIQQAAQESQKYQSTETKKQWDAIYNQVIKQAGSTVAQAEEAVMAEKLKQVQSVIDLLAKAREELRVALDETGETPGDYLYKKEEIETRPGEKWSKLYVKFGFKGDFAKFLNEQAVTTLRKMKENALKKLDQLTEKIASLQMQAVGSVEAEITRVTELIAAKEKEIGGLQTQCRSLPLYRQPKCRASIAAQQAVLASRKAYLNALLKPGKAVVRSVGEAAKQLAQNKALRSITESILEGASSGLEMIAAGINFFNITEAKGEYSWDDMRSFKLPRLIRLVATLEIPGKPMQIVLEDLQFDFKKPVQSASEIAATIMLSFVQQEQNKYMRYLGQLVS